MHIARENKTQYTTIIFDMDGTIIETEHIWAQTSRALIRSRGGIITPSIDQQLKIRLPGLSARECCTIIKELTDIPGSIEELVQQKMVLANLRYQEGITFIDGFEQFHHQARRLQLKTGLATNATTNTVTITDKKLNLRQFFGDHIYTIDDVHFKGKPNPDIYLLAAENLLEDPRNCIAIEDSAHGIAAAKAAGMFCIGINTAQKAENLKQADLIVDTYEAINLQSIIANL